MARPNWTTRLPLKSSGSASPRFSFPQPNERRLVGAHYERRPERPLYIYITALKSQPTKLTAPTAWSFRSSRPSKRLPNTFMRRSLILATRRRLRFSAIWSRKGSTRSTRISGRYSLAVERQPAEPWRRSVFIPLQPPAALTGSSIPGRFLLFENPSSRSRLRRRSNPQFDGPLAVRFVPQRGISSSRDTFCVRFVLEAARGRRMGLQRHGSGSKSASAVGDGRRNRLSSGCRAISSFLLAFSKIFDHETAE